MSYSDQNFPRRLIAYRSYSLTGCRNKFFRDYPLSLGSSVFIAMNMAFESQPIGGRQLVGTAPTNDATKTTTHIAVACWFAGRVLARPYSVARSKSLHCLCTALARSLWTRSSLESEKFTVRARFEPSLPNGVGYQPGWESTSFHA